MSSEALSYRRGSNYDRPGLGLPLPLSQYRLVRLIDDETCCKAQWTPAFCSGLSSGPQWHLLYSFGPAAARGWMFSGAATAKVGRACGDGKAVYNSSNLYDPPPWLSVP